MSATSADEDRAKRAAEGTRFYMVFSEPREAQGDRNALRSAHLQFLHDLEARGMLLASGPFIDDASGQSLGSSVSIVRGKSLAEVEAIMREEPFARAGFRTVKVQAWRLADGDIAKFVRGS